jgi:hypothetical protein
MFCYKYCHVFGGCAWLTDGFLWPDLLHTYTTCCYTSQTTIWRTISSLLHHLRLLPQETPSILSSQPPEILVILQPRYGPDRKRRFQQYPYCCLPIPCLETGSFIVACMFISAGTCLPIRCLAMNYSGFQASCHNISIESLWKCIHHFIQWLCSSKPCDALCKSSRYTGWEPLF